ncbi:hypothetical protein ATK36_2972 [Amycolatopsis sulphurea]|uniref:RibD domain-containing protein n=1 Tax=Amycolatopsis sulphurea TaxID=76022 RepID=A0A2A9FBN7_9PSEU|nr:hypothetical protein ATK36_2972 [Amycolatopsis sulphurea]
MHKVIVAEFLTLDGIVEDPDGSGGTPHGGWAFRYGPGPVSGDKFHLGTVLDTGVNHASSQLGDMIPHRRRTGRARW